MLNHIKIVEQEVNKIIRTTEYECISWTVESIIFNPDIRTGRLEVVIHSNTDKPWEVPAIKAILISKCNDVVYRGCPYSAIDIKLNCEIIESTNKSNKFNIESEVSTDMNVPEVEKIIHRKSKRGEFFTVKWVDNTETTVKLAEGEESDEYIAFLYAVGKKLFADKGVARKYIKDKKKVFEDEVALRSAEINRNRKRQALQQSLDAEDYEGYAVIPVMAIDTAPRKCYLREVNSND